MPGSFHLGFGSSTDYNFPYWKSFEKFKSKYLGIYALLLLPLLVLFFFFNAGGNSNSGNTLDFTELLKERGSVSRSCKYECISLCQERMHGKI